MEDCREIFLTWLRKPDGGTVAMGGVVNSFLVFSRIVVEVERVATKHFKSRS